MKPEVNLREVITLRAITLKMWRENQRENNMLAIKLGAMAMAILMHQSLLKAPIDSQEQPPG